MARSVIIPAHNEEAVLRRSLQALISGLDDEIAIVVVCNGCTDDTVEIARSFEPRIAVLVLENASKIDALNSGDAACAPGPRVYVDADVAISGLHVGQLFDVAEGGEFDLVEPTPEFDMSGSSWIVRGYYTVWLALHGRGQGDIGGGIYCLSIDGRGRFGKFPSVISDDGFVRWHFSPDEAARLETATSMVVAPSDIGSLVKIKTRSAMGTAELKQRFPELNRARSDSAQSLSKKAGALPVRMWRLVPLYVAVQLVVKMRAARLLRTGEFSWERDGSSRDGR